MTLNSIGAGISSLLGPIREDLRLLLAQSTLPYLELPGDLDGPGICISASFADVRRYVEMMIQEKAQSQTKVPPNYSLSSSRRKLPDTPISRIAMVDASTQTYRVSKHHPPVCSVPSSRSGSPCATQVQSAPEVSHRRAQRSRRPSNQRLPLSSPESEARDDSHPGPSLGEGPGQ